MGLTTTGSVGEAALAAARGLTPDGQPDISAITRPELAQLQRDLFAVRTALNEAMAGLREAREAPGGVPVGVVTACVRSAAALDAVVDRIHHQLRRPTGPAGDQQR